MGKTIDEADRLIVSAVDLALPAMVATGISASKLAQFMSRKRVGAGLLIIVLGIATIAMPVTKLFQPEGAMQHQHHQ